MWLGHRGEDPRYSSCVYEVPVLDWKGRSEWIEARGVSYTTPSEQRDMPEGAREAFPEIAWSSVTVSRYTHKTSSYITSSYITSSYKTSSYKTSIYQTSSYRMSNCPGYKTSRLPNVHFTKRPDYKTSRTQNVQF
jgi:hypothetical protein